MKHVNARFEDELLSKLRFAPLPCTVYLVVNVVLGSKANNGLLGFDLSLIGEWILFEEISVVVRVKDNYY